MIREDSRPVIIKLAMGVESRNKTGEASVKAPPPTQRKGPEITGENPKVIPVEKHPIGVEKPDKKEKPVEEKVYQKETIAESHPVVNSIDPEPLQPVNLEDALFKKTVEAETPEDLHKNPIIASQGIKKDTDSQDPSLSASMEKDLLHSYLAMIQSLLNSNRQYPLQARRMGIEGEVEVRFSIDHDGTVKDLHVAKRSLYSVLDRAAMNTIVRLSPLPPPPESKGLNPIEVQVPIRYRLRGDEEGITIIERKVQR